MGIRELKVGGWVRLGICVDGFIILKFDFFFFFFFLIFLVISYYNFFL